MLSLLFDGWSTGSPGSSASRVLRSVGSAGSAGSAGSGAWGTSERVAQTAAMILSHFADSEVNAAAMVRSGALATLQRALKARMSVTLQSAVTAEDPLVRLIRDVMGRLVNDADAGGDFMRTALRAAAQ